MTNIRETNINRCNTKINTLLELTREIHYLCPKDVADYYTVLLFNFVTEIQQLVDLTKVVDVTVEDIKEIEKESIEDDD